LQVQSDSGTLAPYVPRALLARLARQPIDVLTETVEGTMVFADVSGFTRLSERLGSTKPTSSCASRWPAHGRREPITRSPRQSTRSIRSARRGRTCSSTATRSWSG
jgi:hypothetical protein